jgi:hypothetical protein
MNQRRWPVLFSVVFMIAILLIQVQPIRDGDLFWNLKIGLLTLDAGHPLDRDPLSFNANENAWTQHELGAQLILGIAHRLGGWWALRLLRGAMVGITLLFFYLAFRRESDQPLPALGALIAIWFFIDPYTEIRPQLIGWTLLAMGYFCFLTVEPPWRLLRWISFCIWMVVWVNMHSSALIVLVLCSLCWIDNLLRMAIHRQREWSRLVHWTRLTCLGFAAVLVQPEGLGLFSYTERTLTLNREWSEEWQPLLRTDFWQSRPGLVVLFLALAVLTIVAFYKVFRSKRAFSSFPAGVPALTVILLAAYTQRMLFLVFVPIHLVCRELGSVSWLRIEENGVRLKRWLQNTLSAVLVILGILQSMNRGERPWAANPFGSGLFPVEVVPFLKEVRLQGNMYNHDEWGGFLAYHLYPEYRTFIDGRWLEVGREVFEDSIRIVVRNENPEPLLERYEIDYLVQSASFYRQAPPLDPDRFILAYIDDTAVVILRRTGRVEENVQRVCAFYRRNPQLQKHAEWRGWSQLPDASAAMSQPPSVLLSCSN